MTTVMFNDPLKYSTKHTKQVSAIIKCHNDSQNNIPEKSIHVMTFICATVQPQFNA